jgi:hypothetical protein
VMHQIFRFGPVTSQKQDQAGWHYL